MNSMVARFTCAILICAALAGCSGPAIFGPSTGTVVGQLTIRACGGAYQPDQTSCPLRPLAGARVSFSSHGNTVMAMSDSTGKYRIDLRPGTYTADVQRGPFYRVAAPRMVTVTAGKIVTADFTYSVELL